MFVPIFCNLNEHWPHNENCNLNPNLFVDERVIKLISNDNYVITILHFVWTFEVFQILPSHIIHPIQLLSIWFLLHLKSISVSVYKWPLYINIGINYRYWSWFKYQQYRYTFVIFNHVCSIDNVWCQH